MAESKRGKIHRPENLPLDEITRHFQFSSAFGNRMMSAKDSGQILKRCYKVAQRKGLPTTITPEEVEREP